MAKEKEEEPWPSISQEERTLYEILFYSQGPLDGYILGEGVRDLLLKSGLSLTILSQIWNLADVSNDNVLNVHEFVLILHLIRGVMSGRPVPKTLPRSLTPPKTTPITPPPMSQQEKDAYLRVFQTMDYSRAELIDAPIAVEMFLATKLPSEVLALIWDLADFGRDGKLNPEEFAIACHLLRYAKQGGSLDGPVDIFQYAPQHISPLSLLARKRRVAEYEEHKQRLMSLKERRKNQAVKEAKRLDLAKEKVKYLQELYGLLKRLGTQSEAVDVLSKTISTEKDDIEKQEEIVVRLKKEHEKVRQETVKIILGEQKFNTDITIIKKDTDELNKRLLSMNTHATKDADPFHQLHEQRKEKRQGSTIKDLDKIDIYIPFEFSPFDLDVSPATLPSGSKILDKGSNQNKGVAEVKSVVADLREFGEGFMEQWGSAVVSVKEKGKDLEDDEVFKEVHDWSEDNWPDCDWSKDGLLGLTSEQAIKLKHKLSDLKEEFKKLNAEGGRRVFRNPEDYHARKKAREEEEKAEKGRVQRRSVTERLRSASSGTARSKDASNRYSYSGDRSPSLGNSEAAQAAREYRLKRHSQNLGSATSSPEIRRNPQRFRKEGDTSTGPPSVSDDASLSRESSLSSIDRPVVQRGNLQKSEEDTSTVSTERSSRTDDSGILTLKSSRRKDDLSLELASVALGRPIQIEQTPVPVSSERAKRLEEEAKAAKKKDKNDLNPKPEVPDFQQIDQQKSVDSSAVSTQKTPVAPLRSSKKSRAPPPPLTSTPAEPLYNINSGSGDSTNPKTDKPNNQKPQPYSDNKEPVNTKQQKPKDTKVSSITSQAAETIVNSKSQISSTQSVSLPQAVSSSQTVSSPQPVSSPQAVSSPQPVSSPQAVSSPQRPPRLKKRSVSSESSIGPLSPRSPLPEPGLKLNTVESQSIKNNTVEKFSLNKSGFDSTSEKSNSDAKDKNGVKKGLASKKRFAPVPNEESLTNQVPTSSVKENLSTNTDYSEKQRANKKHQNLENTIVNANGSSVIRSEKTSLKTDSRSSGSNSNQSSYSESRLESQPDSKKSDKMMQVSQSPISQTSNGNPETRNMDALVQLSTNFDSRSLNKDTPPSEPSDSDAESLPPPLPSSAPPPLPAGGPPVLSKPTEDEGEVTVEYTVTFNKNDMTNGGSEITGTQNSIQSTSLSDQQNGTTIMSLSQSETKANKPSDDESPKSKTVSDLRSDFFGLTSSRPQTSYPDEGNVIAPGTTSLDVYFNDFQTEARVNNKISSGNSLDSDVSDDNDSGVHKGGPTSPGDSGHLTSSFAITPDDNDKGFSSSFDKSATPPLLSTQKQSIFSNDSIESAFEDSFSYSSTTSAKLSTRPQNLFDDIESPKATSQNGNMSSPTRSQPTFSSSSSTQRQSLDFAVSQESFSGPSSLTSPSEEKSMSVRSKEIVDKAKHFAEMVQPKYTVTVKRDKDVKVEDDLTTDALTGLELERRAVISQSTVKRRVSSSLSPNPEFENKTFEDTVANGEKPHTRGSNPSDYGYTYSAERLQPPAEVGWKDKKSDENTINLYSENVVKEGDTTEAVDRESIANLSTTKQQWENIFTTQITTQGEDTLKKKGTPKWEVRLPYKEKPSAPSSSQDQNQGLSESAQGRDETEMSFRNHDSESAIEREIRLAHEREEMLKREKEERMKSTDKQQKSQGQTIIASYEAASAESESCQPAYNELTEADRGPDLWGVEAGGMKEEDEESDATSQEGLNPNESIIEREIRLQKERENEIMKMRQKSGTLPRKQQQEQQPQQQQQQQSFLVEDDQVKDVNHNRKTSVTYEEAISNTSHDGESLIARELRELKEREEEIKRLHSGMRGTKIRDEVDGPSTPPQKPSHLAVNSNLQKTPQSSPSPAQGTWQKDVSPFVSSQNRRSSVDSASSHSTGRAPSDYTPSRNVRVQPIADGHEDEDEKPDYFKKQETPIEREMRIAQERENELRRLKGLPEIVRKEDDYYFSYNSSPGSSNSNTLSTPRSSGQPGNSMKKFATSRLQQEVNQQKERESALRKEGKIISTSEEHIQPLKYHQVAGVDKVDGSEKRNYVTKRSSVGYSDLDVTSPKQEGAPSNSQGAKKKGVAAGGQLFSYKEFKQTAESKIERELREMREREEELRSQRTGGAAETPR